MMPANNKPIWPTMRQITKLPKQSLLSKKNHEMLAKIDRWKGKFG